MALVWSDTFSDTAGLALTSHVPNFGGTGYSYLTSLYSGTTGTIEAGGSVLFGSVDVQMAKVDGAVPGSADYTISGNAGFGNSGANRMDLLIRGAGADQGYTAYLGLGGGGLLIVRQDGGGSFTTLASAGSPPVVNTNETFTFSFGISGSTLTLTVNGVTVTATDSTYTAAGHFGIGGRDTRYFDATANDSTAGDTTPPTLTSPTATGGVLVCSGTVSTNEGNGTLYTSFTDSATAPTAVQVEAGQDHTGASALRAVSQAVSATGTQSIASGAITAGTRYAHYMHKDAAGNRSAVVSSSSFVASSGGDTTPPTLTSPTGAGGALSCSGTVVTNEGNGTLYAVFTASATSPTKAQVKAGQDHTGAAALRAASQVVSSTGTKTFTSGAITAGTRYAHYMHEDGSANQSNVVSSSSFTVTSGAGGIITLAGFKTWTGVPYASVNVNFVKVCSVSSGAVVLELTNQAINAGGTMTINDAALSAASDYMVFGFNADGSLSFKKKVTAA